MFHQGIVRRSESTVEAHLGARTTRSNSLWRSTTACLRHKVRGNAKSCPLSSSGKPTRCGADKLGCPQGLCWGLAQECRSDARHLLPPVPQIFVVVGEVGSRRLPL